MAVISRALAHGPMPTIAGSVPGSVTLTSSLTRTSERRAPSGRDLMHLSCPEQPRTTVCRAAGKPRRWHYARWMLLEQPGKPLGLMDSGLLLSDVVQLRPGDAPLDRTTLHMLDLKTHQITGVPDIGCRITALPGDVVLSADGTRLWCRTPFREVPESTVVFDTTTWREVGRVATPFVNAKIDQHFNADALVDSGDLILGNFEGSIRRYPAANGDGIPLSIWQTAPSREEIAKSAGIKFGGRCGTGCIAPRWAERLLQPWAGHGYRPCDRCPTRFDAL